MKSRVVWDHHHGIKKDLFCRREWKLRWRGRKSRGRTPHASSASASSKFYRRLAPHRVLRLCGTMPAGRIVQRTTRGKENRWVPSSSSTPIATQTRMVGWWRRNPFAAPPSFGKRRAMCHHQRNVGQ